MFDGGCQVTRIVWLRPHSNNIPICNLRRADIQSRRWQWLPACRSLEETELSAAQGCKFCWSAQSSLSGRMAVDNETPFTVKGNRNFKGVAHMLLIGRMIIGKENWIERQKTRVLFPEPVQPCVDPTHTAVLPGLDMPATGSRRGGGVPQERKYTIAIWVFTGDHQGP